MLLKCRKSGHHINRLNGEVPERLNGTVSKTVEGVTLPRVQIPLSPPLFNQLRYITSAILITLGISPIRDL